MDDVPKTKVPLLEMRDISKSFPGVRALDNVSLVLHPGEVLALVGENGAGKSTLIKILAGAHTCDSGRITVQGHNINITSPTTAQRTGITVIYQEFNLIPEMSVRENIFLGRERTQAGFIAAQREYNRALKLFTKIGMMIDPEARCRDLTIAQQQIVEIAKALSLQARIIVMDEPSATLTQLEVKRLFAIIQELKSQGMGIIYISHRLDEIFTLADRVMILRDGLHVDTRLVKRIRRKTLIEKMVGRKLESEFPPRSTKPGEECLRVEHLSRGSVVQNVSFKVYAGEILGFAGLVGAGRTETMRLLFGADRPDAGRIVIKGREIRIRHTRDAIARGICLLTEDRKGQGLALIHSAMNNFSLPNLDRFCRGPFVDRGKERTTFSEYAERLKIKIPNPDQPALTLSGGNQQKLVLAKWLARQADIFIFDEPTRGIDVGAKYDIYVLMNALVAEGKAILMVSSELPEILGMSDRILVMHAGRIKGEITDVTNATQEDILSLAIGAQ